MEVSSRLDRIQDEVRSELLLAEKSVFLFSSENFTLVCPERVKAYFERVFGDVAFKIIFFARSQDELAESQYNQDVKWSGLAASFDDFIATTALEESPTTDTRSPKPRAMSTASPEVATSSAVVRSESTDFGAFASPWRGMRGTSTLAPSS
jgi:hypothetical protein